MTRTPSAATYDDDFFAWTQEQADLLRRLAPTAIGRDLDIAHVAEEIEDLGKRDLREVRSFLARLFEHLIKIAWPGSLDAVHWQVEALHFQSCAVAAYSPSMRQLVDLDRVWRQGEKLADRVLAANGIAYKRAKLCPLAPHDVLTENFDLDAVLATLAAARA